MSLRPACKVYFVFTNKQNKTKQKRNKKKKNTKEKKGPLSHFKKNMSSVPVRPVEPSCLYWVSLGHLPSNDAEVHIARLQGKPWPPDSFCLSLQEGKNHRPHNRAQNWPRQRMFTLLISGQVIRPSMWLGSWRVPEKLHQLLGSDENLSKKTNSQIYINKNALLFWTLWWGLVNPKEGHKLLLNGVREFQKGRISLACLREENYCGGCLVEGPKWPSSNIVGKALFSYQEKKEYILSQ